MDSQMDTISIQKYVTTMVDVKEELVNMFVTNRNYAVYQAKLDGARRKGYFLPLLQVYMVKADLMPDEVKECCYSMSLNLNKYRVLYKVYSLIWNC
ncbi:uncharacterized protein [Dysidea avara]